MMNGNLTYNIIALSITTFLIFAGLLTSILISAVMVNASPDLGSGNNSTKNRINLTITQIVKSPVKLKPIGNGTFTLSVGPTNITQPKNNTNLTIVGPPMIVKSPVIKLKPTGNGSFTFGPLNTTQPKP